MVDTTDLKIELVEADTTEHAALFDNLLNLYFYDFAEILQYDINAEGKYLTGPYEWRDPGEIIYLLYVNELPAGFAIIGAGSRIDARKDLWDMHEFFVIRRHRRSGLGRWLAKDVWRRHPGTWDVRVVKPNTGALAFWQNIIGEVAGESVAPETFTFPETGQEIFFFRFTTA
ncbi:MAG: GNAT family N-acetyltransferase [Pseudomonadales bacterium]